MRCEGLMSAVVVVACAVTPGCRSFIDPARARDQTVGGSSVGWIDMDATRRSTFMLPADAKLKFLSEPPPDAALATVVNVMAKLNYGGIDASASAKITESIVQLGDKTQTVMILRELLFRLAEMSANGQIDNTQYAEMYKGILVAVVELAKADRGRSEEKAASARQAADEVAIMKLQLLQSERR